MLNFRILKINKEFFIYIMIAVLLTIAYQPVYHFWQPLLDKILQQADHVPVFLQNHFTTLALTFFCSNGVIFIFNNYIKRKIINYSEPFLFALTIAILATVACIVLGQKNPQNVLIILFTFSVLHGLLSSLFTIADDQSFKIINQKYFSSIYSLVNVIQRLMALAFLGIINRFITFQNLGDIFTACSIAMLLTGICFFIGENYTI